MTIVNELEHDTTYTTTNALSFIERYCSLLAVPPPMIKVAEFISIQIMKQNLIPEKTPHSIAAGIIYFVCQFYGLEHSKSDIAIVCKVSEVTISKCCKKLEDRKADLVPARLLATNK